jgi:lipid A 3-O-deacylase
MRSARRFQKFAGRCGLTFALALGIGLGGSVPPAAAQPRRADAAGFQSEWIVIGGAGSSVGAAQRGDREQAFSAIEWGRIISGEHGPGVLRGRLEMAIELTPVFREFQSNVAEGAGFSPLMFRWNFRNYGVIHPFIEVAGGVVATNRDVPEDTTRLNFTSHAGAGAHLRVSGPWSVMAGYRFHHLSNGTTAPRNPGINSNVGYLGIAYRRSERR